LATPIAQFKTIFDKMPVNRTNKHNSAGGAKHNLALEISRFVEFGDGPITLADDSTACATGSEAGLGRAWIKVRRAASTSANHEFDFVNPGWLG
jgi:hypothetical protein